MFNMMYFIDIDTNLQAARTAAHEYIGWERSMGGHFTSPSSLFRTYLKQDPRYTKNKIDCITYL